MYSVLDHTAAIFLNPISFLNDGDAIRWFTSVVNAEDDKSNISKYPEQFTLYRLADYDDKTGTYHPRDEEKNTVAHQPISDKPHQIITGIQVQEEQLYKFTVKDLMAKLKSELQLDNVVDITNQKMEN